MAVFDRSLVLAAALTLAGPPLAGIAARSPAAPVRAPDGAGATRPLFVPGEVVVKFREGTPAAEAKDAHRELRARATERLGPAVGLERVVLPRDVAVEEAVARYQADPAVEYAEPNWYRYPLVDPLFADQWALENTGQPHTVAVEPGATMTLSQGSAEADIRVTEAWAVQIGDPSVVVAVLDTGVDTAHPDLMGSLWTNAAEDTDGVDDDDNDCIDDVHGCDFTRKPPTGSAPLYEPDSVPGHDHGTHVAGTVAARTDNAVGVAGVCGGDATEPGCALMVLKMFEAVNTSFGPEMLGTVAAEIKAIDYARRMGADVINASFGAFTWSRAERDAIARAGNAGILFVAAAGNSGLDNDRARCDFDFVFCSPLYPASYTLSSILSVAATNHHDEFAYATACEAPQGEGGLGETKNDCAFTSWGRYAVDVAAPGTDIRSTVPGGGFATYSGTSMAAPHAAGVAGLVRSEFPSLSAVQIKNVIMNSAEDLSSLDTMYSPFFGSSGRDGRFLRGTGRLDAMAALTDPPLAGSATHATDGEIGGATKLRRRQSGAVGLPGDVNDVFKRRLRKGERYRVKLVVPSGKDYDLYVWSPGTAEIWQGYWNLEGAPQLRKRSEGVAKGEDERIAFKAKRTGMHFFHVSAWYLSSGSYKLRFKCVTC